MPKKSLPYLLVGLAAALGYAIKDAVAGNHKTGGVVDPMPLPSGPINYLWDELDKKAATVDSKILTLVMYTDDGKVWHEIWYNGHMLQTDARGDEPYADYEKRRNEQIFEWETTTKTKAIKARAKNVPKE